VAYGRDPIERLLLLKLLFLDRRGGALGHCCTLNARSSRPSLSASAAR
jgi:hypothetical protein